MYNSKVYNIIIYLSVDFFPEVHVDHGRVEPEENGRWQSHSLDDDPGHEAIELGLDEAGANLLDLEREDDPLRQVEQEEKDCDLPSRLTALV